MSMFKDVIMILNNNGFRKIIFMSVLLIVGVIFRILDYINGAEFVSLMSGTTIAFLSANGVEHAAKATIEWVKTRWK